MNDHSFQSKTAATVDLRPVLRQHGGMTVTHFDDITYEVENSAAIVTINRPERYNAFRAKTVEELIKAFRLAWADHNVQSVILTGAGEKAFCTGGDVKQRAETGDYGPSESGMFEIGNLHKLIRDIPKPVIAAVNGVAIGGGHVLHVLCDVSLASETARFGQAGPKVGSFDAGFGSAYLARVVGEKKAREIWFWCRQYSAEEALQMGLVNKVVPPDQLLAEAKAWAAEVAEKSPTAIRFLKASFNADTDHQAGLSNLAMSALDLFTASPEGLEGAAAFAEKRKPDFNQHASWH
jgi:dihydroxynaphthoic acid synthetase